MELIIDPRIAEKLRKHGVPEVEAQAAWAIYIRSPEPRIVAFDTREHIDPVAEWILVRIQPRKELLKLVWIESEIQEIDGSITHEAFLLSAFPVDARTAKAYQKQNGVIYV